MKVIFKVNVLLICMIALASCDREAIPNQGIENEYQKQSLSKEEVRALAEYYSPKRVSKNEAIETARDILQILEEDSSITKSGVSRTISDITVIKRNLPKEDGTRNGFGEDTLAYSISFGDGLGYTVLSADHRSDAILAICSTGNPISSEERDSTCGACVFYDNLEGYISQQIEEAKEREAEYLEIALAKIAADTLRLRKEAESMRDTLSDQGTKCFYYSERTTRSGWSLAGICGPLVNVCWHQRWPCNAECPVVDGQNAVAGCVAVAAAQVMSYWEKPSGYNWKEMKTYYDPNSNRVSSMGRGEIARLIHEVGVGCEMQYGLNGSSSTSDKVVRYFRNIGFHNAGSTGCYSNDRVLSSLKARVPLLAGGYKGFLGFGGGHEWVIDGFRTFRRTVTVHVSWRFLWWGEDYTYSYDEYCNDVHCNFGWGGDQDTPGCNGYYNSGAFSTVAGNFNWWTDCIYNVMP